MSNDWWFLSSMSPKDMRSCMMVYKYGLESMNWDSNILQKLEWSFEKDP